MDIFKKNNNENKQIWNYYHIIQTGAYLLMALLIMRLKLFLVPQLCLLISEYSNYPMEKMIEWINLNTRNESILKQYHVDYY
ncbi:unnamed protein product, partial [Rotaria sp. Silwood1]